MVNSKYRENYSKDKTQGNDYSKPHDYSSSELCKKEKKCCIPIFENDFNTGVGISILNYTEKTGSINEIGGILNFRLLSKVGVICDDYSILLTIPKQYKYSSVLCKNENSGNYKTDDQCCNGVTGITQVIDTYLNFVPNDAGDYKLANDEGVPFTGSLKVSSYNNTNLLGFLNKDSSTGVSESRQKWGQYFRASSRTQYITGIGLESGNCGSGISGTIGYGLVANDANDIVSCGPPVMPIVDMDAKYPKIPNEFIVVFHPGTEDADVTLHMQNLHVNDYTVKSEFHIQTPNKANEFRGYSVVVSSHEVVDDLTNDPVVKYVEQNAVVRSSAHVAEVGGCITQADAPWGIARTSETDRTSDHLYSYSDEADGEDVTAYIIDTGILTTHNDFEGRATWGADFVNFPSPEIDLSGHGTHVAGTVCGKLSGVAKKAKCVAVAVLGADGSGSTVGVVNGITWSAQQAKNHPGKAIGNMSLGGGKYNALNDAVNAAYSAGFPMIVAAGNESDNACNYSPASAEDAYTVMSSTSSDRFSSFSNYGSCCDVIAPGSDIKSAWIDELFKAKNNNYKIISGTSMASPHVCGVGAKLLSVYSELTPAELFKDISSMGTTGKIRNNIFFPFPNNTLNLNLHMACGFAEQVTKQSNPLIGNNDFSSTKVYLIDLEKKLGCGKTTVNLFGAYLNNDVENQLHWNYNGFHSAIGLDDHFEATSGYDVSLLIDHDVNCNTEGFLNINYCYTPKLYYYYFDSSDKKYVKKNVNSITLLGLNVGIKNKGCNSILETACLKFQEVTDIDAHDRPYIDKLIEGEVILKSNKLCGFSVPQISIRGAYIDNKKPLFAEIKFDYSTNIDIVNKCVTSSKSEY